MKKSAKIKRSGAYIEAANGVLGAIGFTEHGLPHVCRAAGVAANLLRELGFEERTCELAAIAGYLHDIGNTVNRVDHAQSGALMAFSILSRLGMPPEEVAVVASTIGHHDEGTAARSTRWRRRSSWRTKATCAAAVYETKAAS